MANTGRWDTTQDESGESVSTRPSWDEYFIEIARAVSLRGDCTRSLVGAVLVEDRTHRILSTGYNGVSPGQSGCLSGACPRGNLDYTQHPSGGSYNNCIAKHAERNCLEYAQKYYPQNMMYNISTSNIHFDSCTMFITRKACDSCETLLRDAGIRRVVWSQEKMYCTLIESLDLTMGGIL